MAGRPLKFKDGKEMLTVQVPISLYLELEACRAVVMKKTGKGESPLDRSEMVREALYQTCAAIRGGRFRSFRQDLRLDEAPIVRVGRPAPREAAGQGSGE